MKWLVVTLTLAVLALGCVADAPFKVSGPTTPALLDDGWEIATPSDVGISEQALSKIQSEFVSEDQFFNAISLLIVKNGKLVFESYCRDASDRDRFGHVQSVTKSITSLVVGIVNSEGYIDSLNQTLYSIIPDKFPSEKTKRQITLRHLLTMKSGLEFDNEDFSVEIYSDRPSDPIKYILNKPLYASPGTQFYYRDCDPHLVSYAVTRLTGKTVKQWAAERLFGPLGIRDYYWESDQVGTTMGADGLHLRPRDLAKIGQLILNHGKWGGDQVVDSAWIVAATQSQTTTNFTAQPNIRNYGYYWWVLPDWHAIEAWGHGGNYILIVPDRSLVIVMTSMPDVDDDTVGTRPEKFHELITDLVNPD